MKSWSYFPSSLHASERVRIWGAHITSAKMLPFQKQFALSETFFIVFNVVQGVQSAQYKS